MLRLKRILTQASAANSTERAGRVICHRGTRRLGSARWTALILAGGFMAAASLLGFLYAASRRAVQPPPLPAPIEVPRRMASAPHLTVWWDVLPDQVQREAKATASESNIHPADYVGPEACKDCHQKNYQLWSQHAHRAMNALATDATVKGDFSSSAAISYRGGRASFEHRDGKFWMHTQGKSTKRSYAVTQVIGSRYFQYYVGKQVEGPEPKSHHFYTAEHVLPFGYWLHEKEWVPTVHIGPEKPDAKRADPYNPPDDGPHYAEYAHGCNYCHTTFPLADMMGRAPGLVGEHAPVAFHWSMRNYLANAHPDLLKPIEDAMRTGKRAQIDSEASRYAVTLGVSCEACHLGGREHVASMGAVPPKFLPASPHLVAETRTNSLDFGRTHDNVNWVCGRCHIGKRPQFAGGMANRNSVEYSDAMAGSCYSQLRCIDCHNPHKTIGPKWSLSADQDDALCLKCHEKLRTEAQRRGHTHHATGSEGARCMNCHMPRINEGLEDLVRTHTIFSPTQAAMIEANQPNACNLCHTDRPIDWTLGYLKDWYGRTYDENKIAKHYRHRDGPVAVNWLSDEQDFVRLVAVDALTRARDYKAVPQVLDALDDPYLVNRQFASKSLQTMLNIRLADFGYRFYMTSDERRGPLAEIRAKLLQDPRFKNSQPRSARGSD